MRFQSYYGDRTGLTNSTCSGICPPGYYCPENTVIPFPCPEASAKQPIFLSAQFMLRCVAGLLWKDDRSEHHGVLRTVPARPLLPVEYDRPDAVPCGKRHAAVFPLPPLKLSLERFLTGIFWQSYRTDQLYVLWCVPQQHLLPGRLTIRMAR